jgi:molecular chaperone Hsp33
VSEVCDFLRRFQLERANVTGALVRLDSSWQQVRQRAAYPDPVADLLAGVLTASVLLTGNIKFQGSLSIQLKSAGAVSLAFAECSHDGRLRGLARWQGEVPDDFALDPNQGSPILAITIENAQSGQRYQGLVPVEDAVLSTLFERYFERSEQLPTRILLANDGERCGGLLLQQSATDGGLGTQDPDAWNRVGHLLATISPEELLRLPAEKLLSRVFHEEDVRVFSPRLLAFACTCSRERVTTMLRTLGSEESYAAVREDGAVEVTCEFCNSRYNFDLVDLDQIFGELPSAPAPRTAQ